jgi:hypothetical protein
MPRRARIAPGEIVYYALNRANGLDAPAHWIDWVNGAWTAGELDALRKSVNRGTPYGLEHWTMRIANMLGLEFTLHLCGRPRREMR